MESLWMSNLFLSLSSRMAPFWEFFFFSLLLSCENRWYTLSWNSCRAIIYFAQKWLPHGMSYKLSCRDVSNATVASCWKQFRIPSFLSPVYIWSLLTSSFFNLHCSALLMFILGICRYLVDDDDLFHPGKWILSHF